MNINIKNIPMTKILENLYIGSRFDASNLELLKAEGITHILNMTREVPNYHGEHFVYKKVEINDSPMVRVQRHFDGVALFIHEARNNGRVLVHCACGISRSTTAVIAYFIRFHNMDPETALNRIKQKRGIVWPNFGFVQDLKSYHKIVTKSGKSLPDLITKKVKPNTKNALPIKDDGQLDQKSSENQNLNSTKLEVDAVIKKAVREKSWNRNPASTTKFKMNNKIAVLGKPVLMNVAKSNTGKVRSFPTR